MGLDAFVYCDCFERGRLRTPPDPRWGVYVDIAGFRATTAQDLDEQISFDVWSHGACEHEDGVLLHHRLGNIALVSLLRRLLAPHAGRLPLTLTKVIYSGTHCCDQTSADEADRLGAEVEALAGIHDVNPDHERFLREFERQLGDLVGCARAVRKPIAF